MATGSGAAEGTTLLLSDDVDLWPEPRTASDYFTDCYMHDQGLAFNASTGHITGKALQTEEKKEEQQEAIAAATAAANIVYCMILMAAIASSVPRLRPVSSFTLERAGVGSLHQFVYTCCYFDAVLLCVCNTG